VFKTKKKKSKASLRSGYSRFTTGNLNFPEGGHTYRELQKSDREKEK